MSYNPRGRIRLLSFLVVLAALALISRLFFIQVLRADWYSQNADRQYLQTTNSLFDRGSIFLTEKSGILVSAATTQSGFVVALNPTKITDPETLYAKLKPLLPITSVDFMAKATKANDPYEELIRRVSVATTTIINQLDLSGVVITKDRWRVYPGGTMAAHLIGFLGYNDTLLAGRYGLERFYETVLRRADSVSFADFFSQLFSSLGGAIFNRESDSSGDVVLSVEPTVQTNLEKELANIVDRWHPDSGGGVIMNPQTGAIIALAAIPTFDPGAKQTDLALLTNPLVEKVYEMGSIVKPLTMAAALDAGVLTAKTTYNDLGYVNLNGQRLENFDKKGRGVATMQDVLNHSLNTGAIFAMQQLGHERFRDYLLGFGIGEKTDIDLPNEATGIVTNLHSPRDLEYATAAFGQGIAMSPIAITRAIAALANGGVLVKPEVVREIRYQLRPALEIKPEIIRRVIKPATSVEITRMLVEVVDKALLGGQYKNPYYRVAAKTGTAQIAKPEGGGYYDDRYLHSFFGYFPAYDPKFIIFLYAVHPQGAPFASATLTEPFMNLTKFLLNYYNLPPDRFPQT